MIYVEGASLRHYTGDGYRRTLVPLLEEESPDLLILGHTPNGWDLAPLLAARFSAPAATGCSKIVLENGKGRFTRKAFNGKFVHEIEIEERQADDRDRREGRIGPVEGGRTGTVRSVDGRPWPRAKCASGTSKSRKRRRLA